MAEHPMITRRRVLGLFGAVAALPVLSAWGSGAGGGTPAAKLLVVTNAGAGDITRAGRIPYIGRASSTNGQISAAMGGYLAESGIRDGVYAIAPDYAAGNDDSPRGPWTFENQTPRQHIYLRTVENRGGPS